MNYFSVLACLSCHNKYYRMSALSKISFSKVWRLKIQDQGGGKVVFILRPLCWASQWPPSLCVLISFLPCVRSERGRKQRGRRRGKESFLPHLLIKTLILLDQGLNLMTSFNLNVKLSPLLHIQSPWGLGTQHRNMVVMRGMVGNKYPVYNMQFPS